MSTSRCAPPTLDLHGPAGSRSSPASPLAASTGAAVRGCTRREMLRRVPVGPLVRVLRAQHACARPLAALAGQSASSDGPPLGWWRLPLLASLAFACGGAAVE